MHRSVLAAALLALAALSTDAQASCGSRDRMSNCFEPRGNDALSILPNRDKLQMPTIDPHVASPRLRRLAPPVRADRRRPNLLHWSRPAGRQKRFFSPCVGLACDRFGNQPACRAPFC